MSYCYITKSRKNGKFYIGSTTDLNRRLRQHQLGHTRTTKILEAFDLVYFEEFDNIQEARNREKKLKSYKSHKYIEWLIGKDKCP